MVSGLAGATAALLGTASVASACSNWIMNDAYGLSVRTMDLGSLDGDLLDWGVATHPVGAPIQHRSQPARFGFVAFVPDRNLLRPELDHFASGGLNTEGLSCDGQTLLGTVYPPPTNTTADMIVDHLCEWALAQCSSVAEVAAALANGTVAVVGPSIAGGQHYALRDRTGASVVVEFLEGRAVVTADNNDGGKTGFGVMTNEPDFAWHVRNVKMARWKEHNARPAFTVPGAFYPDERFLRIHLVKQGMSAPASYAEAVSQAVHVLNTVTVPMGSQLGTDSSQGEGNADHTQFAAIYDHRNATMYWRTQHNQNLQRLRLADSRLGSGGAAGHLRFSDNPLPWFNDAAGAIAR